MADSPPAANRQWIPEEYEPGLVSVIIPTHNRAAFLPYAVASVWAQSYRPIQLIVVDDGSTDDTTVVVKRLQAKYQQNGTFTILPNVLSPAAGAAVARNWGLRQSLGEYIQFLDDDDALADSKLRTQVNLLRSQPGVDVAVSQVTYCDSDMHPLQISRIMPFCSSSAALAAFADLSNDIPTHAPLHRRRLLAQIGGWDERVRYGQEVDLHFRLAIAGACFHCLPESLAYVRCHRNHGRMTMSGRSRPPDSELAFYRRIVAFAEARKGDRDKELRACIARRLFRIAMRHFANLRPDTGKGCLLAASTMDPAFKPLRSRIYMSSTGGLIGAAVQATSGLVRRALKIIPGRLQSLAPGVSNLERQRSAFPK